MKKKLLGIAVVALPFVVGVPFASGVWWHGLALVGGTVGVVLWYLLILYLLCS